MATMALFDDTLPAFEMPAAPLPRKRGLVVDGWVKTFQRTGGGATPCLNVLPNDGNDYRPARFELRAGLSIEPYAFSKDWPPERRWLGVRAGKGDLLSLFDAIGQRLAWEVTGECTE